MPAKALLCATLAAIASSAWSVDAQAITCYVVYDRSDNVTYRDVYPPVDLSDAGRAEREAMRRRGEFLMFLETDQCPRIEYFTGAAGSIGVQLDRTVAEGNAPAAAASGAAPAPGSPARKN